MAAASPPCSFQRTMWPKTLFARGLAGSVAGPLSIPRLLLLVSVQ